MGSSENGHEVTVIRHYASPALAMTRGSRRQRALLTMCALVWITACKKRPSVNEQTPPHKVQSAQESSICSYLEKPRTRPSVAPEQFERPGQDLSARIWADLLSLQHKPIDDVGDCGEAAGIKRRVGEYLAITMGGPMTAPEATKPNFIVRLVCAPAGKPCASLLVCELSRNDLEKTGDAYYGLDFFFDKASGKVVVGSVSCSA